MYRAGGPVDASLPWSRTAMRPLTSALVGMAIFAIAIPQVSLLALSSTRPIMEIMSGFVVLFLESFAVPIVLATIGAMLVRGRRVLLGPLFALALLPFATALGFALLDYRTLASADPLDTALAVTRPTDSMERIVSIVQALEGRDVELALASDPSTSSGRGSAGSASSPRHR